MMADAMVGGTVFQVPFGRLSDRIDRRYARKNILQIGLRLPCISMVPPGHMMWLRRLPLHLHDLFHRHQIVVEVRHDP